MKQGNSYGGKYDDLLIECADAIRKADAILSPTSLAGALRDELKISLIEARRVVDDFCERGVLQEYLSAGPYDQWLTAELEAARKANHGISTTSLAKKLHRENPEGIIGTKQSKSRGRVQSALNLANTIYVVDEYFARYGLKGVLGPYPLGGVVIVTVFEALLFSPVFAAAHFAVSYALFGHPISWMLFFIFFLLFVAERTWRNWRKLRSPARWDSYDAARDRLPVQR